MKHIFIAGTSFCSSTVMSLILGSAKGAENVGETNWVVPLADSHRCRLCGPSCEIWTYDFQRSLEADPSDWFPRIADRLRTDILVSSEKSFRHIERLAPDRHYRALVLFKRPENFWHSIRKRPWRKEELDVALKRWANLYNRFLDDAYHPSGGKIFVGVEKLMSDPGAQVPKVLEALGLEHDVEEVMQYWKRPQHYIGGNFDVYQKLREDGKAALRLQPITTDRIAAEEFRELNDRPARDVIRRLEERDFLRHSIT